MYNDEIREIKRQSAEASFSVLKDILVIYIKCRFIFKDDKCCDNLITLFRQWLNYSWNERDILNYIKKYFGDCENKQNVDEVLDYLEETYDNMFWYYDKVLADYEDALLMHQVWRSNFKEPNFVLLDEKAKKKCLEKLRHSLSKKRSS